MPVLYSTGSPDQDEARELQAGRPVEREIAGGEVQAYTINLTAGDYLSISVRPKGLELVYALFLPDGAQASTADVSHGPGSPATIVFVAEVSGRHTLRIHASVKGAVAGRYEVEVAELKTAGAGERDRFYAGRAFAEGQRLALTNDVEKNRLAITTYGRAMELYRQMGDRKMELMAMIAVAECHLWFGDPQQSLVYYEQANRCAHEIGERYSEANIRIGVGRIQATFGNHQEALNSYNQALEIYRGMSARYGEALTLSLLGQTYHSLGDDHQALALYERALPTFNALSDFHNEGSLLNLIGQAHADLGELPRALEFHTRALTIARKHDLYRLEVPTLGFLGNAEMRLGDRKSAVETYRQSLLASQKAGLRDSEAAALRLLAEAALADGNTSEARTLVTRALEIFRSLGRNPEVMKTLSTLAQVHYSTGDLNEARREMEAALEIGESLRSRLSEQELRQTYFASVQNYFQLYIDILMQLHQSDPEAGYVEAALSVSERARARSLLELLFEAGVDLRHGAPRELLERERILQRQMNAKAAARERLLGNERTAVQAAAFDSEIEVLAAGFRDVEAQIRSASPAFATLMRPQPLPADEIKKLLDESTVLLEFTLGEKRSWLWAVTAEAIEGHQLPPRNVIEAACRRVYATLTARQPGGNSTESERRTRSAGADARLLPDTKALSDILFGSIASKLRREWKHARLVIVASGALEYTPFAALPLPACVDCRPLIAEHEIVTLPSASALALIRGRIAPDTNARTLAILADPVVDAHDPRLARAGIRIKDTAGPGAEEHMGANPAASDSNPARQNLTRTDRAPGGWRNGFSRLPFSREEAERIAGLVSRNALFMGVGFQANRAVATSGELGRYRMVHFATHGLLNSEHPELSGLVLSLYDPEGNPQDGFLRLNEIYNLELPADLVVLSACQTALGKEIRGEGMIGLTRGFMYAGARRVVASLWQVDDLATAELMAGFYRGMLKEGLRPSDALRKAQLGMARQKRWASPYFWAGFTLQGEWR